MALELEAQCAGCHKRETVPAGAIRLPTVRVRHTPPDGDVCGWWDVIRATSTTVSNAALAVVRHTTEGGRIETLRL